MIADITPDKMILRAFSHRYQRFEVAGIGKLVKVDDTIVASIDQVTDHSGPNKARPTSDNDSFQFVSPLCRVPDYRRPGIFLLP
jgi:hypothetical protein